MKETELYPLKFEPIYQYRIWGGRRLSNLLAKPLPANDPIGEAWILSDRDDHPSRVAEGALRGKTIGEILSAAPAQLFGRLEGKFRKFPLLLKFLDCQQVLSVQVHPADRLKKYISQGESGKTEAWVVLETGNKAKIYAGLKSGTTEEKLRDALEEHEVADYLAAFTPKVGDSVLIKAGTVHTLDDVVVFEVQENSDITYRLYDWDRVDKKTGNPRDLQVEQAIACIDFTKTAIGRVKPIKETDDPQLREKILDNDHFVVWRHIGKSPFMVGKEALPRILVCIEGTGELESNDEMFLLNKGEVMLLPAICGTCPFVPRTKVTILEIALPETLEND
ncbi:MAG TPA: type I phosphomannose isomerase catalytic subunit [Mucilaginibacter sp.]|jgi:mannose-6-phosphate isomerase